MDTVVAKILIGVDEKGYMYSDRILRPDVCQVCNNRILDLPDLKYRVKRTVYNLIVTYDNYKVVSKRFKDFCESNGYGLEFTQLLYSKDYFVMNVPNVFHLDYDRSAKFMSYRSCCGSFDEVIGLRPGYKDKDFSLLSDDFISRSEHRFGSFELKSYAIIVGLETAEKIKREKLRGLNFADVYL